MIGGVILAAGESARFSYPKQLYQIEGQFLLERVVETALCVSHSVQWAVVLGGHGEKLLPWVRKYPLEVVVNPAWGQGIGTSLQKGLKWLVSRFQLKGVVFLLVDQWGVTVSYLESLLSLFLKTQAIVASSYAGTLGVPVCFPSFYFPALFGLPPHQGAKELLYRNRHNLLALPFPQGEKDIDTPQDIPKSFSSSLANSSSPLEAGNFSQGSFCITCKMARRTASKLSSSCF